MEKLTKRDKYTDIYYDQTNAPMHIQTYDTKLIKKLLAFQEEHPELCALKETYGEGCCLFEIDKSRISIHLVPPYPEERRKRQSEWAKEHSVNGRITAAPVPGKPEKESAGG